MAITSTVIGNLGAGKVTESRFTFTDTGSKEASDVENTWNIPAGRHLLFWQGTKTNGNDGYFLIDGQRFGVGGDRYDVVGGYMYVDGPKTVVATGGGSATFGEDPYMSWVKVAA